MEGTESNSVPGLLISGFRVREGFRVQRQLSRRPKQSRLQILHRSQTRGGTVDDDVIARVNRGRPIWRYELFIPANSHDHTVRGQWQIVRHHAGRRGVIIYRKLREFARIARIAAKLLDALLALRPPHHADVVRPRNIAAPHEAE